MFSFFNVLKMSALIQLPKILTLIQKLVVTFLQEDNDKCNSEIAVKHQ